MSEQAIDVHDQLRAALVARLADGAQAKALWGFHVPGLSSGPAPRIVHDESYWHLPRGTRISRKVRRSPARSPQQEAHDLGVGKRVLQSGNDDLIRRWLNGENVEHELG